MSDSALAEAPPRHKLSSEAQPFVPTFLRHLPANSSSSNSTPHQGSAPSQLPVPPLPVDAAVPQQQVLPTQQNANDSQAMNSGKRGGRGQSVRNHHRRGARGNPSQQQQRHQQGLSGSPQGDHGAAQRAATSMLTTAAFGSLLAGMPDEDVSMLMQSMPAEVQQLYGTHFTHHTRLQQGGRSGKTLSSLSGSRGDRTDSPSPVMTAALATFGDLTQDQLLLLESSLWQMGEEDEISAYRVREGGAVGHEMYADMNEDGGIFLNADDGLQADEEEWLLEQMMATEAASRAEQTREKSHPQHAPQ